MAASRRMQTPGEDVGASFTAEDSVSTDQRPSSLNQPAPTASGHSSIALRPAFPNDSNGQKMYNAEVAEWQFAQAFDARTAGQTPFLNITTFMTSQGIMSGQRDVSHLTTCFSATAQGRMFRAKKQPAGVVTDPTVPSTDQARVAHVAILVQAFKSVALAVDNDNSKVAFMEQRHDNRLVEAVLWELLDALSIRSSMAGPYQAIFGVTPKRGETTYLSFAHRFDEVVKSLASKKSICKILLDPTPISKLVDDPVGRRSKSLENQTSNRHKQEKLNQAKSRKQDIDVDEDEIEEGLGHRRKRRRTQTSQVSTDAATSPAHSTPDLAQTTTTISESGEDDLNVVFGSTHPQAAYTGLRTLLSEGEPRIEQAIDQDQNDNQALLPTSDDNVSHDADIIIAAPQTAAASDVEQGRAEATTSTPNIWQGYNIDDLFPEPAEEEEKERID